MCLLHRCRIDFEAYNISVRAGELGRAFTPPAKKVSNPINYEALFVDAILEANTCRHVVST